MLIRSLLHGMVKPIWYYNLKIESGKNNYWINYKKINNNYRKILDCNNYYESEKSFSYDLAYQMWHKGAMKFDEKSLLSKKHEESSSLNDQYIFIRRMFKPRWIYFSFIIRLLSFKISIKEINVMVKTRFIKQINLSTPNYKYENYEFFQSKHEKQKRLVTIIIPTLNRFKCLNDVLKDLENQTYKNFEVIVVDQSDQFNPKIYNKYQLNINLVHQKEKALWRARNTAIKKAKGKYLLFFDDDSRVKPEWVFEHLKCIDYFNVEISAGVSKSKIGSPIPAHYNYFRWADQLDTGNVLIKRKVFQKCGLFDTQFEGMRMGDGEFGLRAYLKGFKSINNPKAERLHLKVSYGGLREMGSWDSLRPKGIFYIRPIPSVLYFYRRYWGNKSALISLIQTIPFSLSPYILKGRFKGNLLSFILFIFFSPIILFQVLRSWLYSSKMIKQGSKIENY